MSPFFSVIMLSHNREKLMPLMSESVLAQDFSDFEFIIIDHGSTDKSGEIADSYAEKDKRVRVIHSPPGNIGHGRNIGIDAAKGKYIAFVDDDDEITPDYLSFHKNLIETYGADISICGTSDRVYDELKIMSAEEALVELFSRKYFIVQFPAKTINRKLFSGVHFSETAKFDDVEVFPMILSDAVKVVYRGLSKYIYNRHDGSESAWATDHKLLTPEILDEYLSVYKSRTKYLCEKFPENKLRWKYYKWSFMISMVDKIGKYNLEKCKPERAEMIAELRDVRDEFLECPYILDFEKENIEKWII
jgi:glycosyltransferase involved in cell wall biosynthesis